MIFFGDTYCKKTASMLTIFQSVVAFTKTFERRPGEFPMRGWTGH